MHRFIKAFSLSLSFAIILMMGSMQLNIGSHSVEHQHHSAKTHTTGICAWMCAAAQTISTDSQIFTPKFLLLRIFQPLPIASISTPPQIFLHSRAPPKPFQDFLSA
ncbi:MAG: hypothetical protein WD032_04530 [Nitrospirales bacterium]